MRESTADLFLFASDAAVQRLLSTRHINLSCIQVSIFDDRIEVLSPGMLYGGLDMQAALAGKSKCRNAAVSEASYYMGMIEAWGTGLGRIRKSCQEYGLKEPGIEEFGNGFRITLYRNKPRDTEDSTEMHAGSTETSTETHTSSTEDSTESSTGNAEERLIQLLIQQPGITQQEAADKLGYSKAWIRKIMKSLQQKGVLHREGSTKKGKWIVSCQET
ncbi:ATP-binding protein [Bacilliculturomica massiliensis]|uniref:ATP-binding protein n=1 Tax=Bacilliculturomica massiliensis TaxID=1917867 RepID=UPI0013EF3263|nr:ATP-binding protein [Bacilliculturomica massiliensis]